jgi:orotate phosphoribosyltransferase
LVVDDVITTGGSTLKAVEALRAGGITVDKGICILDREEGGFEAVSNAGVQMYSIFKKSDFGDEITRGKE